MNYIEVRVPSKIEYEELLGIISDSGFLGSWENEGILHIYWPQDAWDDAFLEDIRKALGILGAEGPDADPVAHIVEDRDWNAIWAASLKPIRLGRRIRIRQSWNPEDPSFDGIELVLDPRRAFGTGYHETTQLILEWLEETIKGGERILDIGTGSGILSMAAIRLGARTALAVDIDTVAIDCAKDYARLNGFRDEIEFRVASFEDLDSIEYDLIVSNIDCRTLFLLCPHLTRLLNPRGVACFSGLQTRDYEKISAALADTGYAVKAHRRRGEWLALEITSSLNVQR